MGSHEAPEGYVGWMNVGDIWLRFPDAKEGENGKKEEKKEEKKMDGKGTDGTRRGFERMEGMLKAFQALNEAIAQVDAECDKAMLILRDADPGHDYPDVPKLGDVADFVRLSQPAYLTLASLADTTAQEVERNRRRRAEE